MKLVDAGDGDGDDGKAIQGSGGGGDSEALILEGGQASIVKTDGQNWRWWWYVTT